MGGTYRAPDMAAANREAVYAQAQTFPIIRAIETASRLGTEASYPVYDASGNKVGERRVDFTGMGDVDLTRETARALAGLAPEQARLQLQASQQRLPSGQTLGEAFAQQRRAELEALDPTRYGLYESFLTDLGRPSTAAQAVPEAPTYERVGMPAAPQDVGSAAQMRRDLERQIASGLAQAGTLDPAMMRAAEQAARARGTATGNILGNLSAFREARAVNEAIANADVQRRQQALGLLQSGQTTSDVANRQAQEAFQNILAATGQRNTAAQQTFAGQMAQQQQRQNVGQQNIANIQSALGLQPIVSQAAQLGGLQQGASPFAAPQLLQGAQMASPAQAMQMGSNFALSNAQSQFQASQANSPLAIYKGVTEGIGNLGQAFSGFGLGCYVARECIPDQWEAFYFWKELVGPKWFKNLYDANAKTVANWIKDKPIIKKVVANWMLSKIKSIIPKG
jgi:hypothetical protein